MSKNLDAYITLDKTGLENKYVIIVNGEVVAKGENIEEMLDKVRQEYPHEIPFVAKVPEERMMPLEVSNERGYIIEILIGGSGDV